MKLQQNNTVNLHSQFINLHGCDWLEKQRIAAKCHVDVMQLLKQLVADKTNLSLLELDKIVENEILKQNCTPTFRQYRGFPSSCCMSVNKQLVHGIATNYKLQDGDVITFDFGATFEGAIVDSADTMIYGDPKSKEHVRLINTTRECLYNAIKSIVPGKRIGIIGNTIYKTAQNAGFGVITKFGGHGINWNKVHSSPFIANKSIQDEGVIIQSGMSIAIEPLCSIGSTDTKTDADGWTIWCDGEMSAHFEHSIFVHSDRVEIMTWRQDENIEREIYW
jgi:methionyl aminopeptidase